MFEVPGRVVALVAWPVALLVFVLVGCGGGVSGSDKASGEDIVSTRSYVAAVDDLCLEVGQSVMEIAFEQRMQAFERTNPTVPARNAMMVKLLEQQLSLIGDFVQRVERVGLPRDHRRDAEQILSSAKKAESHLSATVAKLRRNEADAALVDFRRYATESLAGAQLAAESELDFNVCGGGA
jgi:hypothetical protein